MNQTTDNDTVSIIDPPYSEISPLGRRLISAFVFVLLLIFICFTIYICHILIQHKLWVTQPFFLWFLSLGIGDIGTLVIYVWGCIVVMNQASILPLFGELLFGHLSAVFYFVCLFHYPIMAAIRAFRMWFPVTGKNFLENATYTVAQIVALWVVSCVVAIAVQIPRGNWVFFSPYSMTWEGECPECYTTEIDNLWSVTPMVCVGLTIFLYALCIVKLHIQKRQIMGTSDNRDGTFRQAQQNMVKIGGTMSIGQVLIVLFWRIKMILMIDAWWSSAAISLVGILIPGANAFLLYLTSADVKSKCFQKSNATTTTTTKRSKVRVVSVAPASEHHGLAAARNAF